MGTARRLVVTVWEGVLLRRFVLYCGAQIKSVDFWFASSRLRRRQFFLFSRLWIAGRRPWYMLLLTGVYRGQVLDLFLCPSWYYGRLPSDRHGGYVTGWK